MKSTLNNLIYNIIENQEILLDHHISSLVERNWLSHILTEDIEKKINKYILGSKEHGGGFLSCKDRDNNKDIDDEITDLFFYIEKQKYLKKNEL